MSTGAHRGPRRRPNAPRRSRRAGRLPRTTRRPVAAETRWATRGRQLEESLRARHVGAGRPRSRRGRRTEGRRTSDLVVSRQDHLAPVPDGRDPRHPVDLEPAVVVAGKVRLPLWSPIRTRTRRRGPRVGRQRTLAVDAAATARRPRGRRRNASPSVRTAATMGRWRRDQLQMGGVRVVPARAQRARERHGAFDVGAQEGHGPGREGTRGGRTSVTRGATLRLRRSARVASIAMAASGRSSRIDLRPRHR